MQDDASMTVLDLAGGHRWTLWAECRLEYPYLLIPLQGQLLGCSASTSQAENRGLRLQRSSPGPQLLHRSSTRGSRSTPRSPTLPPSSAQDQDFAFQPLQCLLQLRPSLRPPVHIRAMRPLTEDESKIVFTKLANYIVRTPSFFSWHPTDHT